MDLYVATKTSFDILSLSFRQISSSIQLQPFARLAVRVLLAVDILYRMEHLVEGISDYEELIGCLSYTKCIV